jgi:glycosyltransferase involved in cell wall biosynthesis
MTDTRPSVSIITPCYNGSRFLKQTIASVVSQTLAPREVIVVDDGSTDDSASIAEAVGPPVRVIRQANQGESVARNVGIAEARGDHVLFLDADDLLEPRSLEVLTDAVSRAPGSVALMGFAWFTHDPKEPSLVQTAEADEFLPGIIGGNFGPPHCWLTPINIVRQVNGFHSPLRWFEDWDMWCRIALTGAKLTSVQHVGALYRQHSQSQLATTKKDDRSRGHVCVMERLGRGLLERKDLLSRHGVPMFWSGWSAYHRALETGVSWNEVKSLAWVLEEVVRCGPSDLRRSTFGRLIRALGLRWADGLRDLMVRKGHASGSNSRQATSV